MFWDLGKLFSNFFEMFSFFKVLKQINTLKREIFKKKKQNKLNTCRSFLLSVKRFIHLDCFFLSKHQTSDNVLNNMLFTLTSCHCLWSPFSGTVHISSNLVLPSYPANIHNFQSYTAAPCAARATGFLSKSYINGNFFNNKI